MNAIVNVTMSDMERMALAIAKSSLFGVKNPEQALALMLIAQAEGMHPAIAARDYHVIQGRPALKADAMLARFQQAGGKVKWVKYTDAEVSGVFSHPSGGEVEIGWTLEQAKRAGLTGKDVWRQYPRQMLRARVISEGIRTVYPGVAVGVYTVEETQDFSPPERDMGPVEEVNDASVTAAQNALSSAEDLDTLRKRWVNIYKQFANDQATLEILDRAKNERKTALLEKPEVINE